MRVLLISAIVTHSARSNPEWSAEFDVGDFPPTGLMYIAGFLRKHAPHHQIKIIDANTMRYTHNDLKREIIDYRPDIVGMTLYTDILYDCLLILKDIKAISKKIYVAVGGAHPINHPEETMDIPEIDFACTGEGEILFAELLEALEGKRDMSSIKGLVYRDHEGNVLKNEGSGYIEDLDSLPHPAFDLLPFKKYYSMIGTGVPAGVLCSSRGCPYKCTYCSKLYDTYRARSAENIIEEIKLYYDQGIREFLFFDDTFNLTAERALTISKAIGENFKDIEWSFRGRADQITEELARELKNSNCKQVSVGAEAHTDEIQKELRTGKRVAHIKNAVKILRRHKIKLNTNWIVGLPQHKSRKDIMELLKVIFKIDPDYVQFSILMLWDDTELFREAAKRNIVNPGAWREFMKNPTPDFLIPCWTEHMSLSKQCKLLRECYIRFYLRPKVIFRQIMDARGWTMLKLKFKGFIIMLTPLFYPILKFFKLDLSNRKNIHKL